MEREPLNAEDSGTGDSGAGHHLDATALTRRTASSAVWLIAARLTTKAFDFLTLLVLARLLAPGDFGIIAIAMTSVTIVEAVFELPIYQVLISLDHIERRDLDTAFTLAMIRGVLISLALATVAVPFAHFYGDHRLVELIAILSLAPVMRGMGSPQLVIFAKRLDYRRELASELVSKLIAFILASVAAWVWQDYRALMVATLTTPAVWIVATYALAPYRPRFSLASWRRFAHFMSWTTGAQLLSALNWQCDRLLLGRFVARAELGSFSLANDLSFIPEQALIKPIVRPLISAFALIRDDRERIAAAYLTTASVVLAIGTPVLLGLSLLAEPAVRLALGGKWVAAIPILHWLSLTLIPPLFTSPFSALALASGRPRQVLHQAALEAVNKLPLMLVGASLYGVAGAIAARGASSIITALIVLVLVERMLGTPIIRQLAVTWRTMAGGMMLAMVLLALRPILNGKAGLELGGLLAGVSLTGAVSYAITLAGLWHLSGRPAGLERTIFDRFIAPTVWRLSTAKH
jgi:O-antigen/teichoic acid export membrane protein